MICFALKNLSQRLIWFLFLFTAIKPADAMQYYGGNRLQEQLFKVCSEEGDDVGAVRRIMGRGIIDANLRNDFGLPLLHVAVESGNKKIAEFLIRRNALLETRGGFDGSTALHAAACQNKPECVGLLLGYHANDQARTGFGSTPLHYGVMSAAVESVQKLVDCRASIDVYDSQKRTPFYYACRDGRTEIVSILRQAGAGDSEICELKLSDAVRDAIDGADLGK